MSAVGEARAAIRRTIGVRRLLSDLRGFQAAQAARSRKLASLLQEQSVEEQVNNYGDTSHTNDSGDVLYEM